MKVIARCATRNQDGQSASVQAVDLLRSIARWDAGAVFGRYWTAAELDCNYYLSQWPEHVSARRSPETQRREPERGRRILGAEELLELAAGIHLAHTSLFARLQSVEVAARDLWQPDACRRPFGPLPQNADLVVRCDEYEPYEVVTENESLVRWLQADFAETDTVC